MIDLDEILEALEDCRDRELEFLDTCERVARKFNVPQDFVEALYDSLDGVEFNEDEWEDVIRGGGYEEDDEED